jgi:hypothetical protein
MKAIWGAAMPPKVEEILETPKPIVLIETGYDSTVRTRMDDLAAATQTFPSKTETINVLLYSTVAASFSIWRTARGRKNKAEMVVKTMRAFRLPILQVATVIVRKSLIKFHKWIINTSTKGNLCRLGVLLWYLKLE